jgi:hypothetical protein
VKQKISLDRRQLIGENLKLSAIVDSVQQLDAPNRALAHLQISTPNGPARHTSRTVENVAQGLTQQVSIIFLATAPGG